MRYVLRADATAYIGSGHVMRSSAIAEELIARGENVIFVGKITDTPWLTRRIASLGFTQIHANESDFSPNSGTDILILDSYIIPSNNKFIRQETWQSLVLLADNFTPNYAANLVIRPGLSIEHLSIPNTKVLAGPSYIPFRKSIQKVSSKTDEKSVIRILVVGGGSDTHNFVTAIYSVLRKVSTEFQAFLFTNAENIINDPRFIAIPIGEDLDELAMNADLVLTTASTTSLEFVAREVAIGVACAVNNQEQYYLSLSASGVVAPIGRFISGDWHLDDRLLFELLTSQGMRDSLRRKCAGVIDLFGATRIANEIMRLSS